MMPIAEEIEKTVITHEATDLIVEKLPSISINATDTIPISIVNKLVERQIKNNVIVCLFLNYSLHF